MSLIDAAIAATRFGLGARPDEITGTAANPRHGLLRQIRAEGGPTLTGAPSSREAWLTLLAYHEENDRIRSQGDPDPEAAAQRARDRLRAVRLSHLEVRTALAVMTPDGFAERWVRFWSNHFSVSADGPDMSVLAPTLEAEAVRPNAFASFEQLALASILHPAMLVYLDNTASIGPNSPLGRQSGRGLNENLAREVLELHTLGPQSGYRQSDVEAFARALTGWTIGMPRLHDEGVWGQALYDSRLHERGAQTILGVRYPDTGGEQARAVIRDLARSGETARRLSEKLAQHFLSDTPSPDQINHIDRAWRQSGGDLAEVAAAIIHAPGAFDAAFTQFKSPEAFLISALRALDVTPLQGQRLAGAFAAVGQIPFTAPSPEGWPDDEASWADPDSIKKRLEFSNAMARQTARGVPPLQRAEMALGERLSAETGLAVQRADSEVQGLTLLLMSPDFLRR
jgi:uncharacterized protein (DUF1800 family)